MRKILAAILLFSVSNLFAGGGIFITGNVNISGKVVAQAVPVDTALDKVSGATPVAAYSLRQLRAAYVNYCIRVRRSSDNAEQDIGFTDNGSLDISTLLAFVGSGSGYVSIWYDQSGHGYNFLQATAAKQPKIVNSGSLCTVNGKPSILLDGVAYMDTSNNISINSTTLSAFVVAVMNASCTGAGRLITSRYSNCDDATQAAAVIFIHKGSAVLTAYRDIGNLSSLTVTTGSLFQASSIFNGVNHTLWLNGTVGTPVGSNGTFIFTQLGLASKLGYFVWNGNISEVVIYSSLLSDKTVIENNQKSYYGIS